MEWVLVPKQRLGEQLGHMRQVLTSGELGPTDQAALQQESDLVSGLLESQDDPVTVPLRMAERFGWLDNS